MADYTPEQVEDITKREKAAIEYLKENQLTPAAGVSKVNIGGDMFVDKVQPFLQDTKYTKKEEVVSPIQDVIPPTIA